MERKELLSSREYWLADIQLNVFNLIEKYRLENKMTRTQLGEKLGVSKGYVSQILNGDFDHKISKLVDLAIAFNKVPILSFEDIDKYIEDDIQGIPKYMQNKHVPKNIEYNFYLDSSKIFSDVAPVNYYNNKEAVLFTGLVPSKR